jgi:hypothetical protein
MRGTTKNTTVKILSRTRDADGVIVASSKPIGKARLLSSEPIVVRNAHSICIFEEALGFGMDEFLQTL